MQITKDLPFHFSKYNVFLILFFYILLFLIKCLIRIYTYYVTSPTAREGVDSFDIESLFFDIENTVIVIKVNIAHRVFSFLDNVYVQTHSNHIYTTVHSDNI